MSNKQQLQTNNTALDALITRVNAAKDVAASLPEAGGSGGGSVETCIVTLSLSNGYGAQYTDSNMQWITAPYNAKMDINVAKNTLIILDWTSGDIATGSCSRIFFTPGTGIYLVTGDCSFSSMITEPGPI